MRFEQGAVLRYMKRVLFQNLTRRIEGPRGGGAVAFLAPRLLPLLTLASLTLWAAEEEPSAVPQALASDRYAAGA